MYDYELITMDAIIRPVYRIFKEYSLNCNIDACPCCVYEERVMGSDPKSLPPYSFFRHFKGNVLNFGFNFFPLRYLSD